MTTPDSTPKPADFSALQALVGHLHALKELPRRGWIEHGIPRPESVADHSFGVAIMTLFFARRLGLDVSRAVFMALLHDLPESVIGDVTPSDAIDPDARIAAEAQAAAAVLGDFGTANDLLDLWTDFQDRRSPEAVLVHELDRLEMAFQADRYERAAGKRLDEFYASTADRLTLQPLVECLRELTRLRRESG
jgi:putative hydrolase of HD superfamily